MARQKIYLGDSVYAEYDGYNVILTTENGLYDDPSNRIVMEPRIILVFTESIKKFYGSGNDDETENH